MSWLNYIKGKEGLAVVSEVLLISRSSDHTTAVQKFPWRGSKNSNSSLQHITYVKLSDQTSMATPCLVEIMSLVPVRYMSTEQRWGRVAVMVTYSQ